MSKLWVAFVRQGVKKPWAFFVSSSTWEGCRKQLHQLAPVGVGISWVILAQEWGRPYGNTTIQAGESVEWDGRTWGAKE